MTEEVPEVVRAVVRLTVAVAVPEGILVLAVKALALREAVALRHKLVVEEAEAVLPAIPAIPVLEQAVVA